MTIQTARFLSDLFEHGHVRLDGLEPADAIDQREVDAILTARSEVVAADFPHAAPMLDLAAANWAARQLARACRYVLFRDQGIDAVRQSLSEAPPTGEAASQHFSVDLTWRFLPDVDRLSAMLAPDDPLREILRRWGSDWPLSSVGMKGIEPKRTAELLAHDGLRQAYIDRIVARQDTTRLNDPLVRDFVCAALGRRRVQSAAWIGALKTPPEEEAVS